MMVGFTGCCVTQGRMTALGGKHKEQSTIDDGVNDIGLHGIDTAMLCDVIDLPISFSKLMLNL